MPNDLVWAVSIWWTFTVLLNLTTVVLGFLPRWRKARGDTNRTVSVIIPVKGADPALAANLNAFFRQDYRLFELLFAAADPGDPAIPVIKRVMADYPQVSARIITDPLQPSGNPKIDNIRRALRWAEHELVLLCDVNARLRPGDLRALSEQLESGIGLLAVVPVAIEPEGFVAELEAAFFNGGGARWLIAADRLGTRNRSRSDHAAPPIRSRSCGRNRRDHQRTLRGLRPGERHPPAFFEGADGAGSRLASDWPATFRPVLAAASALGMLPEVPRPSGISVRACIQPAGDGDRRRPPVEHGGGRVRRSRVRRTSHRLVLAGGLVFASKGVASVLDVARRLARPRSADPSVVVASGDGPQSDVARDAFGIAAAIRYAVASKAMTASTRHASAIFGEALVYS